MFSLNVNLSTGTKQLALGDGKWILGAGDSCDLMIRDASIAHQHAQVDVAGTRVLIQDLGSSGGTFVNGFRVVDQVPVEVGDSVQFGVVTGRLVQAPSEPSPTRPQSVLPEKTMNRPIREPQDQKSLSRFYMQGLTTVLYGWRNLNTSARLHSLALNLFEHFEGRWVLELPPLGPVIVGEVDAQSQVFSQEDGSTRVAFSPSAQVRPVVVQPLLRTILALLPLARRAPRPSKDIAQDGLKGQLARAEAALIGQALQTHDYDVPATAKALKVGRSTLYRRMQALNIDSQG